MRRFLLLSAAFLAIGGGAQAGTIALGSLTVSAQSAAGATVAPFVLYNPGTSYIPGNQSTAGFVSSAAINMGGATVTFPADANSPLGGIYAGNTGSATSPFYGTDLANTNYFVAEPSDPVNIAFNAPRTTFDLLWGSVDAYNDLTIEFCLKGVCTPGTNVTGTTVATAAGISVSGLTPAFVELTDVGSAPFDDIRITSSGIAFEFEPQVVPAPEPITLGILGSGLVGLALTHRRRTA